MSHTTEPYETTITKHKRFLKCDYCSCRVDVTDHKFGSTDESNLPDSWTYLTHKTGHSSTMGSHMCPTCTNRVGVLKRCR